MIKTFLHVAISKRKRKDHDIDLKKSSIKILRAALLTMLANKNLKMSQNSIIKFNHEKHVNLSNNDRNSFN